MTDEPKKVVVHVNTLNLTCDAPGCDYSEVVENPDESYIDKPCPKCGANLLTREDHESFMVAQRVLEAANAVLGPLFGAPNAAGGHLVSLRVHRGKFTVTNEEDDDQTRH